MFLQLEIDPVLNVNYPLLWRLSHDTLTNEKWTDGLEIGRQELKTCSIKRWYLGINWAESSILEWIEIAGPSPSVQVWFTLSTNIWTDLRVDKHDKSSIEFFFTRKGWLWVANRTLKKLFSWTNEHSTEESMVRIKTNGRELTAFLSMDTELHKSGRDWANSFLWSAKSDKSKAWWAWFGTRCSCCLRLLNPLEFAGTLFPAVSIKNSGSVISGPRDHWVCYFFKTVFFPVDQLLQIKI